MWCVSFIIAYQTIRLFLQFPFKFPSIPIKFNPIWIKRRLLKEYLQRADDTVCLAAERSLCCTSLQATDTDLPGLPLAPKSKCATSRACVAQMGQTDVM